MMKPEDRLLELDIQLAINHMLRLNAVIEETRLLADSMSTHKAFADKVGISEPYLSDILKGKRLPGKKLLKFLKLQPEIVYLEMK